LACPIYGQEDLLLYSPSNLCVFVDESGDLGFSSKSTKYFVVSYILTLEYGVVSARINRLRKRYNRDHRFTGEFKFSNDPPQIRASLLDLLSELPLEIGIFVVEKSRVREHLRDKKNILYNYLVVEPVVSTIMSNYEPEKIEIVVDKRMTKELVGEFNDYLSGKVGWKSHLEDKDPPLHRVQHKDSTSEPCLQAADYVSGSAFRKFEHNDDEYYDMIRSKVIYKKQWGDIQL
jgi:hypothetical protein